MKKDRLGVKDSLSIAFTIPDGDEASLDGFTKEDDVTDDRDTTGLRVERFRDGFAVFTDDAEAPVTIRDVSVFETEDEAQEALGFYAEQRA